MKRVLAGVDGSGVAAELAPDRYDVHVGSVAHHLAHHTTRPLAIVPAGATQPIERVVIGVDASEGGAEAVRWCARTLASCPPGPKAEPSSGYRPAARCRRRLA